MLTDAQERGNLLIEGQCTKIAEALRAAMRSFSDAECRKLRDAIAEGQAGSGVWSCDLTLLRQQLEEALVAAYRSAEQEMGKLETELRLQLQQMLKRYNPQWASPEGGGGEPGSLELPTLGTPSIVLQLDEPWWKRWWRPGRSSERHAAALDRLIENEFSAIAGTLAQTARTQLVARQSSALKKPTSYMSACSISSRSRAGRGASKRAHRALTKIHSVKRRSWSGSGKPGSPSSRSGRPT